MITELVLKNWRSHEDSEFTFSKGTNVLVGNMGSGKSAAMNAISFALFGTFPDLQSKKLGLDDVIMNKPSVKNNATITLTLRWRDKDYTIKREIQRGKGTTLSELYEGDKLLEGPQTKRVNEHICELLQIDYDLFSRAVYSEQNAIDYFLEIPKGQRKQKLDELLHIDRYESARKSLVTVVKRLIDRKSDKETFISSQKEADTAVIVKEIADDRIRLLQKEAELKRKAAEKSMLDSEYRKVRSLKQAYLDADKKVKEDSGRLSMLEERMSEYPPGIIGEDKAAAKASELAGLRNAAKSVEERRHKLDQAYKMTSELVEKAQAAIKIYDERLAELKVNEKAAEEKAELRQHMEKKSERIEALLADRKTAEFRLAEIEESVKKLKEGVEKCPVCESDLGPEKCSHLIIKKHKDAEVFEKARVLCETQLSQLAEEKKALEKKLEQLDADIQALEKARAIRENRENLAKESELNRRNLSVLTNETTKLGVEKSVEQIDAEIKAVDKVLEYWRMFKDRETTKKRIAELSSEMKRIGYDEEAEKAAFERLKEVEKTVALISQERGSLSDLINEKNKRLDEMKRVQDELEKSRQEVAYLEKTVGSLQILQSVLRDAQTVLRQQFTETTNAALTDIWQRIYPYGDYSDLKLAIDESGDYILQVQRRGGEWSNVEGLTSGGERSTACLALRIALALVLTEQLSWLVLDEPTHNLDRRSIRELATTLREHLPKIVDQIFIITHEEELESAASGYLYRLERNKEADEPTRIVVESAGL
jgi:exonuclease SbcC